MVREDLNLEELEWTDTEEFKVDEDALVRSMVETLQAGKINNVDIDKTKVIPTEEVVQAELMDDGEDTEVEELLKVVDTQHRNTGVMFTELLEDGPEMVESFEETRTIPTVEVSMAIEDDTQEILLTEEEMEELGDLNYHDDDDDFVNIKQTVGVPKKHPGQARNQSNRRNMEERVTVSTGDGRNIRVQRKKKNAFERFLLNLSWVDAVIAITGVLVATILIFVLVFWTNNNSKINDLGEFTAVGMQLSDLDTIGQHGINRIVSTSGNSVMGEASVPTTNGQEEKKIMVSVSFTSIERDLKIKFTDKATDKLLEGVAFELEVITPSNETLTWIDEDKDGVIYHEGLAPGAYMIVIKSVGEFTFPSDATKVMVKDTISYQVINVLDEIKTEDEINVAVEDTQDKGNIDSETLLADTIKWVPSDKKVVSGADGYAAIDKATITDPATLTTAALGGFWKINTVSLKVGESADISISGFTEDTTQYEYSYSWSSGNTSVATVSGSGQNATITGVGVGEGVSIVCDITITPKDATTGAQPGTDQKVFTAVVTAAETSEVPSEIPSETPSENPSEIPSENPSEKPSEIPSETPSEKPSETPSENPSEKPPVTAYVTGIKLDQTSLEIKMGTTATLKATVTGDAGVDKTVQWSSDDTKIVTVKDGVITPVAVGTATITATTVGRNSNGGVMFEECKVTVKSSGNLTLTVNPTTAEVLVGETYKISPVVENFVSDKSVTFSVDKEEIATVDKDGVVTGVAKGTAVVTITTTEKGADGKTISIKVTITVKANPKKDTTTLLKDSNGNQVYIKAADGSYVQAKWADYYTATAFYIQSDPTYTYYGWQTLNGKTYFFDENGKKVTGEQVISGVKYNFASDGSLSMNGGVLGIDVSKWNGTIDWNAVKSSGISFVIIRCGYRGSATGVLVQDPKFESYISGATRAGLKVGLYFFSQAINEKEAVEEASMAIALAQDYKITYPIFIDTEWTSGGRANNLSKETRTAICKAFCETIKSAGYTPGIYACKTWYQDSLNVSVLNGYKIWLAQYASQPTYNARYDMWQYTDQGKVNGISTNVDLNISYLGY